MTGDLQDTEVVDEVVHVDGRRYRNVTFRRCRLVYSGGAIPVLDNCRMPESTWRMGDAADRTLAVAMYLFHRGHIASVFPHPVEGGELNKGPLSVSEKEVRALLQAVGRSEVSTYDTSHPADESHEDVEFDRDWS